MKGIVMLLTDSSTHLFWAEELERLKAQYDAADTPAVQRAICNRIVDVRKWLDAVNTRIEKRRREAQIYEPIR